MSSIKTEIDVEPKHSFPAYYNHFQSPFWKIRDERFEKMYFINVFLSTETPFTLFADIEKIEYAYQKNNQTIRQQLKRRN